MKAVWSLWTKPIISLADSARYPSLLLLWILSTETAKQHYPNTVLHSDDKGLRLLVDELQLDFKHVHNSLNSLHARDPSWWSFGKIVAYLNESEPFVHIDHDVFLWNALPQRIIEADVFCQNPEEFIVGKSRYYMPHVIEDRLEYAKGWLPEGWLRLRRQNSNELIAFCCGIFGGNNLDFIHYYASQVQQILDNKKNRCILSSLKYKTRHMVLLEQFMLNVCYETWNTQDASSSKIAMACLFESENEAYKNASRIGYTHLIASAKTNPNVINSLEARVREEYPSLYNRYEKCLPKIKSILAA